MENESKVMKNEFKHELHQLFSISFDHVCWPETPDETEKAQQFIHELTQKTTDEFFAYVRGMQNQRETKLLGDAIDVISKYMKT